MRRCARPDEPVDRERGGEGGRGEIRGSDGHVGWRREAEEREEEVAVGAEHEGVMVDGETRTVVEFLT